jgi:hypothetical protein
MCGSNDGAGVYTGAVACSHPLTAASVFVSDKAPSSETAIEHGFAVTGPADESVA